MARVNTPVSELDYKVIGELSIRLNPTMIRKDIQALAGQMGYRWVDIRNFKDCCPNPTEAVLKDWCSQKPKGERTVTKLLDLIRKIERYDCEEILLPYEYMYIDSVSHPEDTSEGICTISINDHLPGSGNPAVKPGRTDSVDSAIKVEDYKDATRYPITSEKARPCENDTDPNDLIFADNALNQRNGVSSDADPAATLTNGTRLETGSVYERFQRTFGPTHWTGMMPKSGVETSESEGNPVGRDSAISDCSSLSSSDQMSDSTEYCEGNSNQPSNSVRAKGKITFTGLKASEGCGNHVEQMRLIQQAVEQQLRPDFGAANGLYSENGFGPSLVYLGPRGLAGTNLERNVAIPTDKIALVIGNKDYSHPKLRGLTYPDNDASAMASVLTELGFKVICLTDLTLEEMRTAMIAFSKMVGEGVYAVFYYSGHGCEHQGENYLFPVDIASDLNLSHAIRAQEFLLEMQNKRTLMNLIIIDACRIRVAHQETERRHDVRRLATGNTIFAFACVSQYSAYERSNQQNGEYCRELLKHIRKDLRVENIFMEVGAAFAMNNNWAQRPNFESDAYMDCRLTSPVSVSCTVDSFFLKTKLWIEGQKAPKPTTFNFDSLSMQLSFGSVIHNTLDIYAALTNLRSSSRIVGVAYLIETFKPMGITVERYDTKSAAMPHGNHKLCRVKSLQKLKESLFMIFDLTVSWEDGFTAQEIAKVDLGYPCVAGIFSNFSDWVLEDNPHWTAV